MIKTCSLDLHGDIGMIKICSLDLHGDMGMTKLVSKLTWRYGDD